MIGPADKERYAEVRAYRTLGHLDTILTMLDSVAEAIDECDDTVLHYMPSFSDAVDTMYHDVEILRNRVSDIRGVLFSKVTI